MSKIIDKDPMSPTYKQKLVSHGIDMVTSDTIILPPEPINEFPCHYDPELDEYVLDD